MNKQLLKDLLAQFGRLNQRERRMVSIMVVAVVLAGGYLAVDGILGGIDRSNKQTIVRTRQLGEIQQLAQRYHTLDKKLSKLKETFASSELSFEQLTGQLDKIIEDGIGNKNYDLNRGKPSKLGLDYDRQEISVKLKDLSLEQIVKVLHRIEQGDSPLFLGKVDLTRNPSTGTFGASLEIHSIRRSET